MFPTLLTSAFTTVALSRSPSEWDHDARSPRERMKKRCDLVEVTVLPFGEYLIRTGLQAARVSASNTPW